MHLIHYQEIVYHKNKSYNLLILVVFLFLATNEFADYLSHGCLYLGRAVFIRQRAFYT